MPGGSPSRLAPGCCYCLPHPHRSGGGQPCYTAAARPFSTIVECFPPRILKCRVRSPRSPPPDLETHRTYRRGSLCPRLARESHVRSPGMVDLSAAISAPCSERLRLTLSSWCRRRLPDRRWPGTWLPVG